MVAIQTYRKKIDSLLSERTHSIKRYNEEKETLVKSKELVIQSEIAQNHIQEIAKQCQKTAHDSISNVVSRCIKTVYGEDSYNFKIEFQKKRGKTEAKIIFEKDGFEYDPTNSTGGGVVDIASFALRLACIKLTKPSLRKIIIADEPWKNIHGEEYQERAANLLESLAEEMDIQMIVVTGLPWLKIGKIIEL